MAAVLCPEAWRRIFAGLVFLWHVLPVAAGPHELLGHAIVHPPTVYGYDEWWLAGTVIPTEKGTVICPAVANRQGMIWHKSQLYTPDFEVIFNLQIKPASGTPTVKQGFAFWYVEENATAAMEKVTGEYMQKQEAMQANEWPAKMTEAGFDLFGYKSKFKGLGVVFSNMWPESRVPPSVKLDPSVSAVIGDGVKSYKLWSEMPVPTATKINYRTGGDVPVSIRVEPSKVKVTVMGSTVLDTSASLKSGGYVGFSSLTGDQMTSEPADFVLLKDLKVMNYASVKGEEEPKPTEKPKEIPAEEKQDVLHEASKHKDHRDESEAIKELTNSVFKLVVESEPLRQQMNQAINSLSNRVEVMEKAFNLLKSEIDLRSGHNLDKEFEAMKSELTSLSQYASTEHESRHKKLESLHKDLESVKASTGGKEHIDRHLMKLTDSTQRTLDNIQSGHQRTFGVSIGAIAFIVVAGLALYNKFRCWEKKHIL
eukprot:gnl/MRDRNA2_/MRDRNA2_117625_c0_seq1.p1 gnl/MRDRNA2_/MRDRNA2_117625_c0~~gnl/MRDRNA2_/MRDRNA2_117625_c0_seq1.p1  ORF type:complete len:481 (+),score=100.07 gnl/MRDRNA2_/MRDRNA2_117625_c0_seq1:77-1519(+)